MPAAHGLVRSMLVIGSSNSVGILLGIIRVKVLAVLMGATGVGVLGIYDNIHQTGQMLAGLGLDQSGVRSVAASHADQRELGYVRRTLGIASLIQGALGMVGLWLLREPISLWVFNDPDHGFEVGLLGLGILLSLISASQIAQLQGLRRIDDLAKTGIIAGVLTTVGGIAAVWQFGADGLVLFVLAQPVFTVLVAARYVACLPRITVSMNIAAFWRHWRSMAGLGATFMFAGLLIVGGLLAARSLIVDSLGLDAAGHFQAAWAISMQCVGFVLGAMGVDYFPRLTAIIGDRVASTALVNDQTQIGLAVGGPVLLIVLGFAPWVIPLLYSGAFGPAVELLQWMCIGNLLRLASWPIGFILIAREDRLLFAAFQLLWLTAFLVLLWMLLPTLGVEAAGPAFVAANAIVISANIWAVRRLHGFRWQRLSWWLTSTHLAVAVVLLMVADTSPLAAAGACMAAGAATGVWGARLVAVKIGPEGPLGRLTTGLFRLLRWPLPDHGAVADSLPPGLGK